MPAIRAEPCVGATNPVRSRIVVVLPAPLGPRKATTCPLGIENETSRTARNDPNCLQSPSASIMTGLDIPVRSSANSSDNDPCTNFHIPARSVNHGTIKGGPADRRGASRRETARRATLIESLRGLAECVHYAQAIACDATDHRPGGPRLICESAARGTSAADHGALDYSRRNPRFPCSWTRPFAFCLIHDQPRRSADTHRSRQRS